MLLAFHEETQSDFQNLTEIIFDHIGNFHFDAQRLNIAVIGTGAYEGKEHTFRIYPKIKSIMWIAFENMLK